MNARRLLLFGGIALLLVAAALIAWGASAPQPAAAQDGGECDGAPCPAWIVEAWAGSGHADATAEAFRHWDEEDPKAVPVDCAKCHSEAGYLDFLGADGTAAGVVDNPAPVDTVVSCTVCHNPVAITKTSVVFPSGIELTDVGESARCMECHQGRAAGVSVSNRVAELGLGLDDVSADLGFINIHYYAAAASLFGSEAAGGFQYEGQSYQPRFAHVPGFDSCADCHNAHTLELEIAQCTACHTNVASAEDFKTVRMPSSMVDYDGDGSLDESTYDELEGLNAVLYQAIQAYAAEVAGTPIVYDSHAYPYFFIDTNANGEGDADEINFGNRFASWTPRLLQAAFNFQMYKKDPGAFAHNSRYHVQLMHDSIASLNEALGSPLAQGQRNPPGHFDGRAEAFRHWDAEGEVPAACVKCHTAEGLPMFLKNNATIAVEPSVALACSSCHAPDMSLYVVNEVKFPSGATVTFGEGVSSNTCLHCHQGRESTKSVNTAISNAGVGDDEVTDKLSFRNVHYFAAGATLFGSEAQGVYQYEGKDYVGRFAHVPGFDTCVACHDAHVLAPNNSQCATCHVGATDPRLIRLTAPDYDGDGATEGVFGELETMHAALLTGIQAYATGTVGTAIAYDAHAYPYWFIDGNGNGVADPEEANFGNRYVTWTPRLLRAAYNYQYAAKDPGAYVHNGKYVAQVLYDSIEDIGGSVAGMTRP